MKKKSDILVTSTLPIKYTKAFKAEAKKQGLTPNELSTKKMKEVFLQSGKSVKVDKKGKSIILTVTDR